LNNLGNFRKSSKSNENWWKLCQKKKINVAIGWHPDWSVARAQSREGARLLYTIKYREELGYNRH
jgi:hypothetical protein